MSIPFMIVFKALNNEGRAGDFKMNNPIIAYSFLIFLTSSVKVTAQPMNKSKQMFESELGKQICL